MSFWPPKMTALIAWASREGVASPHDMPPEFAAKVRSVLGVNAAGLNPEVWAGLCLKRIASGEVRRKGG